MSLKPLTKSELEVREPILQQLKKLYKSKKISCDCMRKMIDNGRISISEYIHTIEDDELGDLFQKPVSDVEIIRRALEYQAKSMEIIEDYQI